MSKPQNLDDYIKHKGVKKKFLAEYIGVSKQTFAKKLKKETPFKVSEVRCLTNVLDIPDDEVENIFFTK